MSFKSLKTKKKVEPVLKHALKDENSPTFNVESLIKKRDKEKKAQLKEKAAVIEKSPLRATPVKIKKPDAVNLLIAKYPSIGQQTGSFSSKDIYALNLRISAYRGYVVIETRSLNSISSFSTKSINDIDCIINSLKCAKKLIKKEK